MDPKVTADQEEGDSNIIKKPETWKLSKIPVSQVYKKNAFRIFSSYAIKDFETTITIDKPTASNIKESVSIDILSWKFLKGFIKKKKHRYVHLGLVQVAIKPLTREGLGSPIVVCLRDRRHRDFRNSLLATVQPNLSEGPFYFHCFPSFSVSVVDALHDQVLSLDVMKNVDTPLAVTYRVVCKAMLDLNSQALEKLTLGKTNYFQGNPPCLNTTVWEDVLEDKGHA